MRAVKELVGPRHDDGQRRTFAFLPLLIAAACPARHRTDRDLRNVAAQIKGGHHQLFPVKVSATGSLAAAPALAEGSINIYTWDGYFNPETPAPRSSPPVAEAYPALWKARPGAWA